MVAEKLQDDEQNDVAQNVIKFTPLTHELRIYLQLYLTNAVLAVLQVSIPWQAIESSLR